MRGFKAVAAAVLIGLMGVAAGCGSSDDETSPPLTKAQLIKQGDRICEESELRRNAGFQKYIKEGEEGKPLPGKAEQEQLVVDIALPEFERQAEELSELTPPAGDEEQIDAIITAMEEAVERVEDDPASVLEGAEKQFGEAEKLGREYGFDECGRS